MPDLNIAYWFPIWRTTWYEVIFYDRQVIRWNSADGRVGPPTYQPPRYDDVFYEGVGWLDTL